MNSETRFEFGKNWQSYALQVGEDRVRSAEQSLREMLGEGALAGKTFADVGCGSGIFSLAARRLGASRVASFDCDPDSVAAALAIKERFAPGAESWTVQQGSILDESFVSRLGEFDCVYSWGVLHHTGDMWAALDRAARLAAPGGTLFIALYNDQGLISSAWMIIKKFYNSLPAWLRPAMAALFFLRFWLLPSAKDMLRMKPFATIKAYRGRRGMSAWHDVVDWVGGYPFEVAAPRAVVEFCAARGFTLLALKRAVGHGCNEFIFLRNKS